MKKTGCVAISGAVMLTVALAACGKKDDTVVAKPAAPVAAVPPPAGQNWTETVVKTPEGGFRMGNPDAPVKLVEFGSLSCSHCAAFDATGVPALEKDYVASGKVSYELRNYIRDGMDLALALLARCQGPQPFYPMVAQMFAAQPDFFAKAQALPAAQQSVLQQGPPAVAKALGIEEFVGVRGIPAAKAQACLTDKTETDALTKILNTANTEYNIQGTPTFLINGKVVPDTAAWEQLEPQLKTAIGG